MVEAARERLGGEVAAASTPTCSSSTSARRSTPSSPTPSSTGSPTTSALFERLRGALRPGGRIEAQCGGEGNVARFYAVAAEVAAVDPFREHLEGFAPTTSPAPARRRRCSTAAGFTEVRCWLEPRPVQPPEPAEFIETVCLGAHLDELPGGAPRALPRRGARAPRARPRARLRPAQHLRPETRDAGVGRRLSSGCC